MSAGNTALTSASRKKLLALANYRVPMRVTEGVLLSAGVYYRCPRCRRTLDREFMAFCDRCGQRLDWRGYSKAKLSLPGQN